MRTASLDPKAVKFNRQSLKNALRELEIDFSEGPKEFVMRCFFGPDCASGKISLYLNALDHDKPGVYHCFKCNARGSFDSFVMEWTGWGPLRVGRFLRKHRACELDPNDTPPVLKGEQRITDDLLSKYAYRHDYCYDRGLTEETLRRYKIGYDRAENDIIFPWFDRVGKLTAIKRRAVMDKYYRFETDGSIYHLLFGLNLVRPRSIVWIMEGEFDAMYVDQCLRTANMKMHGTVALGGKYLHEPARLELLKKTPVMIVRALDGDDDGRAASEVIFKQIQGDTFTCALEYAEGIKDPNEMSFESVITAAAKVEQQLQQQTLLHDTRYQQWKEEQQCVV